MSATATYPTEDSIDAGYDLYRLRRLVMTVSAFVASADLSNAPAAELMALQSELAVATMCVGGEIESRPAAEQGPDEAF